VKNNILISRAKKAVMEVFSDTSSTREETAEALTEIAEDISVMIEALGKDQSEEKPRFTGECTCRPIRVGSRIMIGGEDDCMVHGFGDDIEEEDA